MGKGGGGGGSPAPTSTTAYQTNLPEYAKPYVLNMLGAAQNQLFTTSGGEITGFRPYQPYSTDPTKYFAGPSGLQQSAYNAAGMMRTPGQYQLGTQLAGTSGVGQLATAGQAAGYGAMGAQAGQQGAGLGMLGVGLGALGSQAAAPAFGAGQQFAQQVTTPGAVQAFMSPYQQAVTDVQKAAAVREAQIADQAARLGAARQGTYGGARETLMRAERERGLLSNLANIQAQGSQSAYDRAMQNMQFGANIGLQGIQTGLQGVQTGMQGIQQGLAGTGQAMQGAGVGLQGVGAQQAGLSGATQAAGALGQLGTQQQAADINAINLQNQLGQQQQQYQQNIINQAIQDYATAQQYPYMQLSMMSNLLRGLPMQSMTTQQYQAQPSMTQQLVGLGGTAAMLGKAGLFKAGGQVKGYAAGGGIRASLENRIDDIAEAGGVAGLKRLMTETQSPEAKRLIAERIREMGIAAAPAGDLGRNMAGGGIVAFAAGDLVDDPMMQFSGFTPEAMAADEMRLAEIKRKKDIEQYNFLKEASPVAAQRMLARDPSLETRAPVVATTPTATQAAPMAAPAPAAAPAAPTSSAQEYSTPTGLAAVLAERKKLLGFDGEGEKSKALMQALEERAGRLGKEAESDRYLRAAQAFAQFGSTAGPLGKAAAGALGEFAKGEAGARKEQEKMNLEVAKMQADLEKAQRAEARGDLDAAEKFYNSAEDRRNRISVANASANKQVELIERAMNDPKFMEALRATKGLDDKAQATALTNYTKWEGGAALTDPEYRKLAKAAKDGKPEAVQAFNNYREQKFQEFVMRASGGSSGKPTGGSGKVINYSDIK